MASQSDPKATITAQGEGAAVPTLYEWMGGSDAISRLIELLYQRVPHDELLAPVFAGMAPGHAAHVASFVAEVFGGPPSYSAELGGGHARMVSRHLGRALTEAQRSRWVSLVLGCADDTGIPTDPEFRSAFVAYLEWGSRIAVVNSQEAVHDPPTMPMPRWGWGVPGGPYRPPV